MLSAQEVLDYATKEHTAEFKRAVEKCKAQNTDVNCFAAITSAFKKAGKPIFLSEGEFDLSDPIFDYVELGKINLAQIQSELERLKQVNISADAKRTALRKLLTAARSAGVKATTDLAEMDEEGILAEYHDYSNFTDEVLSQQLTDRVSIELSGVALQWESLGHALRVTGELMKPGVYQGLDGKKCRWTDRALKKHYKTLYGMPVKIFHKAEGMYRKLPAKAGEVVGHITHLAEYFGRIFYKALVFPKKAQKIIQYGYTDKVGRQLKMKESLEAYVELSKPDASGVRDVKAWQGIGFVFTDRPAVKGRDESTTDPVALARNKKMGNPDDEGGDGSGGEPPKTPPVSPEPPSQTVTLSASDLQNIVKSAVGEATKELGDKIAELAEKNEALSKDLKELADVRNEARLAEIIAMEEDIKENDPDFKPEMLYDPEKTSLAERERILNIYIRGMNKGAKLKAEQKPAVILAEEEDETWHDEVSLAMYGKPFKEMLVSHNPADSGDGEE